MRSSSPTSFEIAKMHFSTKRVASRLSVVTQEEISGTPLWYYPSPSWVARGTVDRELRPNLNAREQGTFIDENDARGTLYSYKYTDPEAHPVPLKFEKLPSTLPKAIHPLGVAFHPPTRTLYTISHVHPPSILVFKLSSDGTAATFKRRITHPLLQTPNSITPISDHEVYVTNDHFFKIAELRLLAQAETYLAYPGGSVVYYDLSTDTAKKVANIPFANGVALLPTGRLAVASTTTPAVFIYDVDPASHELSLNLTLKPQFLVDNLKTDSAGMLYLAGHPYAPALEEAAKANNEYDVDGTGAPGLKPEAERPRAGSWVAEWDGNAEGALRDLYAGWEYGCSATAVRDPKVNLGLVTGLYERGVMVWREKKG